jgi:hypothetical protein
MSIESYSAEVLRRSAGHALTLRRLHETLRQQLGPAAGTYHQLQHRLKQARSAFVILERPNLLVDDTSWPESVRTEYTNALHDAGLDTSPIVSLAVRPDAEPGLVGVLGRTLGHLCDCVRADPALQPELITALTELPALEQALAPALQPTRSPRDPPAPA